MRRKNEELLKEIFDYVEDFTVSTHRSPSTAEIASEFNVSRATAFRYLSELANRGDIKYIDGQVITEKTLAANNTMTLNVYPSVSCGLPELEEAPIEGFMTLSTNVLGPGEFFAVRANGNSMIGAGINNNDIVFAKVQHTAHYKDLVIALTDGSTNTLKRYLYDEEKGRPYLHPENEEFEDMYPETIEIQGVVVYILKQPKQED